MAELDDAIREFIIECHENLGALETDLLGLEKTTGKEKLKAIFRAFHTIKGSAGFLGFSKLEKLTHAAETLLGKLRDGALTASLPIINVLLSVLDATKALLTQVEKTGEEGAFDPGVLIGNLQALASSQAGPGAKEKTPSMQKPKEEPPPSPVGLTVTTSHASIISQEKTPGFLAGSQISASGMGSVVESQIADKSNLADATVRIHTHILDKLLELASELVLARNRVLQCSSKLNEPSLTAAARQVNKITTNLQENLMKTRMQPIRNLFSKLPRLVRETANDLGKKVRLEMAGAETELDKTLLEAVKEPLIHLVRNAIDHGIELPSRREAAGKPAEGVLFLYAYHESSQVNLVISDDGAGIDLKRVRQKALEKSLLSEAQAASLNDTAAIQLLFLPGFSTAEKLSTISGRGVGMDVVKSHMEKIGGSIEVQSKEGKGTTVHLRIPLTLTILRALSVMAGGESLAIPQANITELLRLEGEKLARQVEKVPAGLLLRYREKLVPLLFLGEILSGKENPDADLPSSMAILLLQTDDVQFGLVVDAVSDTHEIVVKPLPRKLKDLSCYSGATINSEGRVQLILDVHGLARWMALLDKRKEEGSRKEISSSEITPGAEKTGSLLLVADADDSRFAIPLEEVERLEVFDPGQMERSGSRLVAQYREGVLPLIDFGDLVGGKKILAEAPASAYSIVVYRHRGELLGLAVGKIIDTVPGSAPVESGMQTAGGIPSGIIGGRITGFPNLGRLLAQAGFPSAEAPRP
ncbi:MAG: chemotaxis protein CheA [Gemmataceae bacterium]|nr:chemotaxis protein CheA [Gemmataceae bacterium]